MVQVSFFLKKLCHVILAGKGVCARIVEWNSVHCKFKEGMKEVSRVGVGHRVRTSECLC